ncbi:hydrolase [Clostridium polyendosporum]|uniref:Hydrolase n=1 Tax=Clostridium polyendosporum TaxID=69208 RepID=A0A919VG39_9CLOT|nr:HAD family phosphatase [Clostridium polyendosporum]GIM28802.1 hydrolase [Clostridium polyendosporum]
MSKVELVIFDMDGLMFDTETLAKRAWQETGKIYNYDISQEFLLGLLGMNKKSIAEEFRKEFGENFPFDEIYIEQGKCVSRIIEEEGLGVKEGLRELLDYLTEKKIKKAVATSSIRERAEKLLSIAGVLDKYDRVICGDEVTKGKPDPEIFVTVCKKLDVDPANAIVLEDSERGLEAAVAGGIRCIMVPDLVEPSEKHTKLAHSKVKNLIEVINLTDLFS